MRAFEFLTEWVKRKGYMQFYSSTHADERIRQRGISDQKMETMLNNMGNDVSLQIFTEMTPMERFWVYDPQTKVSVLLGNKVHALQSNDVARFSIITVLNGRPGPGEQTGKQQNKNTRSQNAYYNKGKYNKGKKIKNSNVKKYIETIPYFHLKKGYVTESIKNPAGGDCYEANGMIFRDIKSPTARLVHADITPRLGKMAGGTYGHAWIEDGDKLVDHTTGSSIMDLIGGFDDMPAEFARNVSSKSIFYGIADPKNIKKYDTKAFSDMIRKHKHWGPWELPTELEEYKLDNEKGLGSTPNNSNVDYMGFRTMMKPTTFLKLAKPLPDGYRSDGYPALVQKIKSGESIGSPFLDIEIPNGWEDEPADFSRPTKVTGHEGRHRMHAILELEGDVPVEVHLWGRFEGSELRRKYMTDEMFDELEKGLISETGQYIVNPFLSIQR